MFSLPMLLLIPTIIIVSLVIGISQACIRAIDVSVDIDKENKVDTKKIVSEKSERLSNNFCCITCMLSNLAFSFIFAFLFLFFPIPLSALTDVSSLVLNEIVSTIIISIIIELIYSGVIYKNIA